MARSKKTYGNESISALKGADRVRKRPGVIFGSDGLEGCEHAVFEILSNSIDEARGGFGDKIVVTKYRDNSIEIEDHGRGIPMDYNPKEDKYNWELVFCELYAGGKYDADGDESYQYSLGLNGLGLCATQYSSEYMDATVVTGGYKYQMHFEKGEPVGDLQKEATNARQTGTKIRWRPDLEVFTDIDIPDSYYHQTIKRQAVVNPGVLFLLRIQGDSGFETTEYFYQNGIKDYVQELAGEESLTAPQYWQTETSGRDRADKKDYKVKLSVSCCFSNRAQQVEYYHNSSFLEHGGSPERAVKNAFVYQIDAYLKQNAKYLKGESKITYQDVEDCLILVSSSFSTQTSYENQTKKSITNPFIAQAMTDFLKKSLEVYFLENPLGACKLSRDAEFQAIIPVRGKILNCLKAEFHKIFKNDIINDIIKVLGCGVEVKSKANKDLLSFDINQLRWNKVIICTDADVDGFQIRTLILTMLYRLTPTLIDEGYVFIAESPLYEINTKNKTYFAYTESEKTDALQKIGKEKFTIQRSKGLGENDPDMMWMTTMNPDTRRLIKVTAADVQETARVFDLLLGDNLSGRKDFIATHGQDYLDVLDVS